MSPLLSVIVPVYNVKDYLRECVESILNQSYKCLEIILVNDGSTDGSGAICDELSDIDNRIKVVHKENGGLSSSRNAGLELVSGDYLTFVDSDDVIIGSDVFRSLINKLTADPRLDVIQYDVLHKYKSEQEHTREYPFKKYTSKTDILDGYLSQNIHVSCCDKIFKAKVFRNIRFPKKEISEDIAVIPQIVENINNLETINIGYYGYRYREGSISNSTLPYWKICSILNSYSKYLKYAIKFPEIRKKAIEAYSRVFWSYLSEVRTSYPDKKKDICNKDFYIKLSFRQWLEISKGLGRKSKICSFLLCVCGIPSVFIFQGLFTRK